MPGRSTSGPGRRPSSTARGRPPTGTPPSAGSGVCRPTRAGDRARLHAVARVVDRAAAAAAGLDVVRRRSGGGAVLVTPDDPVWIDVWVPAGDPLWRPDVTGAFGWLGSTWARALERLGARRAWTVQGPAPGACTRWSSLVCFGGVGAGEVTVGGRKVVGLAQRRNRSGAWFHGACLLRWDPTVLLGVARPLPGGAGSRPRAWPRPSPAWPTCSDRRRTPTRDADADRACSARSAEAVIAAFVDSLP